MPAPKRTRTQREGDYAEVARLDRRGWTQQQIADKLGISRAQVGFDLAKIRRRYAEQANVHAGERIGELLQSYRDVRREAWLAWQKSWEDAERVATRIGGNAGDSVTSTREGRLPGSEYLRVILDTFEHERRLLGLDETSVSDLLTVESVVALANAIMSAIGRRVSDPQLVEAMKADVLAMLPRSVELQGSAAAEPLIDDADDQPAIAEPDPPADPHVVPSGTPEGLAEDPSAALNGVCRGGDLFDSV